jgi:hypothetical protein
LRGKPTCAFHDAETRARAQKLGGEASAKERRAHYLDMEGATEAIQFHSRPAILATLERVARFAVAGELDTRAVNATIIAANGALAVLSEEAKAAKARAASMSDDELREAMEAEFREWSSRQETTL